MNNLYLSFSVVFPLFCMMALGYFLRAVKLFNTDFLRQLNNLSFKVFLPLILFVNIYKSDFKGLFSVKLVVFALSCVAVSFAFFMLVVPLFEKDNLRRGVIVQGIFRSNFILFGIPITASLYGAENTSTAAILIAFVIPLYNALSVVALEVFSETKSGIKSIVKGVVSNPLIIASACAFAVVLTGISLPVVVEKTITDISNVATPLALIILGGSFRFQSMGRYKVQLTCCAVGKLVLLPAVFVSIAVALGYRGLELAALFAMFASPTAVSSYTMAQSAGADDDLAGQIVVINSITSVLTIFIGVTVLINMGLIC